MPGRTGTEFFKRAGLEGTRVGSGKKDDPAQVAAQSYEALMSGKDHVVAASFGNKAMAGVAKVLPEATKAQEHRRLSEPGKGEPLVPAGAPPWR
ncbi:hypothetical protein AB0J43_26695 [Nonomuraea fuscirosea]